MRGAVSSERIERSRSQASHQIRVGIGADRVSPRVLGCLLRPGKIGPFTVVSCTDAEKDVPGQVFGVRRKEEFSQPRPIDTDRGMTRRSGRAGGSRF